MRERPYEMKNTGHPFNSGGEIQKLSLCAAVCLSAATLFITGCAEQSYSALGGVATPTLGQISKEELREQLNKFEDNAVLTIHQTASKLDALNPSRNIIKTNLMARVRLVQAYHVMAQQTDPVIAFIESWALSKRVVIYFEEGEGSILYGQHQPVIVDASRQIAAAVEKIGTIFLNPSDFAETDKLVSNFARQNPIRESFSNLLVYATETLPGQPSPFSKVAAIPMAPFKAMEGVDRTAASIYSVRGSMERFSDIAEGLPESARWQLLLLLTDLEDVEVVRQFSESMAALSASSVQIAGSTETLPQRLREEAVLLIDEIDQKQSNLQVTLDKAHATAAEMEKTLSKARDVIEAAGKTADEANQTLAAWNSAADSTTAALHIIDGWVQSPSSKDESSTFKITDYRDTAQDVTKAAAEIHNLLQSTRFGLIDHLVWRAAQLAVLIFLLAIGYRVVNKRWISPPH